MGFVALGEDEVVMTHRLENGVAPSSFGVSVARMAGVPHTVLARAQAKATMFRNAHNTKPISLVQRLLRGLAANDVDAIRAIHEHMAIADL